MQDILVCINNAELPQLYHKAAPTRNWTRNLQTLIEQRASVKCEWPFTFNCVAMRSR